jgi:phosphohistidine phosphatase SixA
MRGFGELHYMRRISDEKDIEREFVISHLPQVEKLAELLRDHPNCPAGRSEEDQSGEAARIP